MSKSGYALFSRKHVLWLLNGSFNVLVSKVFVKSWDILDELCVLIPSSKVLLIDFSVLVWMKERKGDSKNSHSTHKRSKEKKKGVTNHRHQPSLNSAAACWEFAFVQWQAIYSRLFFFFFSFPFLSVCQSQVRLPVRTWAPKEEEEEKEKGTTVVFGYFCKGGKKNPFRWHLPHWQTRGEQFHRARGVFRVNVTPVNKFMLE